MGGDPGTLGGAAGELAAGASSRNRVSAVKLQLLKRVCARPGLSRVVPLAASNNRLKLATFLRSVEAAIVMRPIRPQHAARTGG